MTQDDQKRLLPVVQDAAALGPSAASPDFSRRAFVTVLSSAMAAVGAGACNRAPREDIVPYVHRPPEVVPGVPRYYATSTERAGYGFGLLAETHTGRPTKLEGHPNHPASLGATFAVEQAEILALYDPDRARSIWSEHHLASFSAFRRALFAKERPLVPPRGKGLHLWLEPTASPLVAWLLGRVVERLPETRVHFDPSQAPTHRLLGSKQAWGEPYEEHLELTRARIVVDLSSDFLSQMPNSARWARDFAEGRDIRSARDSMSRLYSVETTMTVTGAAADHRLAVLPSRIPILAFGLLHAVARLLGRAIPEGVLGASRRHFDSLSEHERHFVSAAAQDLFENRGRGVVITGERQSAAVHVVGHALNEVLNNTGSVVTWTRSSLLGAEAPSLSGYDRLLDSLQAGRVQSLFILGGNPLYTAPGDTRLAASLERAPHRVYLGDYENETSLCATWFVPRAHFLESWGDAAATDGTVSFRQPTIAPLFGGKSQEELLALLVDAKASVGDEDAQKTGGGRELLRRYWRERLPSERHFKAALAEGLLLQSAHQKENPTLVWSSVERALSTANATDTSPPSSVELEILPDPRIGDGRRANNAWLQETPEPISKLVWDNAALIHPQTAREYHLEKGDIVELRSSAGRIEVAVLPSVGQAEGCVSLWLGYGRRGSESVAAEAGVDVAPLRRKKHPWTIEVALQKTGRRHELVTTQRTFDMHDREIVLATTLRQFAEQPDLFREHVEDAPTLYRKRNDSAPQWGMTIDLNRCTGCSACVTACVAENNIPVVGKELVGMGREMQWMRVDTYHRDESSGSVLQQPMLCQHCEKAPCEYVCPVNATVHSDDGLNEMVYNRCVGTRFCSNNCPYKVRRFNWFDFNDDNPEPKPMAYNPDVTVRARGVMEKCTFCVQRIRRAEIDAKLEKRPLFDGDVTPACAQACPSQAITFGSLSDDTSRVAQNSRSPRAYRCLNELGTRPRVRYLGRVSNPKEGFDKEGKP